MDEYLMTALTKLTSNNYKNLTIVLGNESCDLDSVVSSLVYAIFLNWQYTQIRCKVCTKENRPDTVKDDIFIPILNVDRVDYPLKTEVVFLLKNYGILENHLIFRDDHDIKSLLTEPDTKVVLVDHHVLSQNDQMLSPYVTEIIDHRPLDKSQWQYKEDTRTTIEVVGSCCTLVTQRIKDLSKLIAKHEEFFNCYPVCSKLLYGDFNGHHTNWSYRNDTRGNHLLDCSMETGFTCLNDGSATRIKLVNNNLQQSSPDITFVTSCLAVDFEWQVVNENLGSDHLLIKISTKFSDNLRLTKKRNFKRADWSAYHNFLTDSFFTCNFSVTNNNDIQKAYDFMENQLNMAAELYIPTVKLCLNPISKFKPKPFWSPRLSEAVAQRRLALKIFRRNPTPINLSKLETTVAEANRLISQAKSQSWQKFCNNINETTSITDMWRRMRWVKATIILDTVNFSKEVNKATPRDEDIILFLENLIKPENCESERKSVLEDLVNARKDVSSLNAAQLLKKDVKIVGSILIPSFPVLVKDFLNKPGVQLAVTEALSQVGCSIALLLGMDLSHGLKRDAAVYSSPNKEAADLLSKHLEQWSQPHLGLTLETLSHPTDFKYYQQTNLSASRKQYITAVNTFINK